jgi:hypothetical protein
MADAAPDAPSRRFSDFKPLKAIGSVGLSLFINGVCPYLLYRQLEPHFPAGSLSPLLYASLFPLFGLAFNLIRTRTVDFIALIALFEISYNIAAALLASTVRWALIFRASEGFIVAAVFLVSALVGRPLIFYISRQFAAGADPEARRHFAALDAADKGRTFLIASLAWAIGIGLMTAFNLTLALTVAPADYLLAAQVASTTVNVLLVVWTIRFSSRRLERVAESLA